MRHQPGEDGARTPPISDWRAWSESRAGRRPAWSGARYRAPPRGAARRHGACPRRRSRPKPPPATLSSMKGRRELEDGGEPEECRGVWDRARDADAGGVSAAGRKPSTAAVRTATGRWGRAHRGQQVDEEDGEKIAAVIGGLQLTAIFSPRARAARRTSGRSFFEPVLAVAGPPEREDARDDGVPDRFVQEHDEQQAATTQPGVPGGTVPTKIAENITAGFGLASCVVNRAGRPSRRCAACGPVRYRAACRRRARATAIQSR